MCDDQLHENTLDNTLTSENEETPAPKTEPIETDDAEFVTMLDVLEEEEKLEQDANAVLGASDEKNCTYSKVSGSGSGFIS